MSTTKTSALAMPSYGYEELSGFPTRSLHRCIPLTQPGNQIRILDLDPVDASTPASTSSLHGSIRVLTGPMTHGYAALSYVWAQEEPGTLERQNRLVIHCADHEHEARLGPNCWSALWHIRKTRKPLGIWVDSICIDQRNEEEKFHQLPMMRIIYTLASETYFWLGEAGKGTKHAMSFLWQSSLLRGTGGSGSGYSATSHTLLHLLTLWSRQNQAGLAEIFGRPWITRLWTLQECLLSRNGVIICGEQSLKFEQFIWALQHLDLFRLGPLSIYLNDSHAPWLNLANMVRWWDKVVKENGSLKPGPLATIIFST